MFFFLLKVQLQRSLALAKESKIIFEIVTVRLLSEFRFFQEQKVHDLGEILQNFINKQVKKLSIEFFFLLPLFFFFLFFVFVIVIFCISLQFLMKKISTEVLLS